MLNPPTGLQIHWMGLSWRWGSCRSLKRIGNTLRQDAQNIDLRRQPQSPPRRATRASPCFVSRFRGCCACPFHLQASKCSCWTNTGDPFSDPFFSLLSLLLYILYILFYILYSSSLSPSLDPISLDLRTVCILLNSRCRDSGHRVRARLDLQRRHAVPVTSCHILWHLVTSWCCHRDDERCGWEMRGNVDRTSKRPLAVQSQVQRICWTWKPRLQIRRNDCSRTNFDVPSSLIWKNKLPAAAATSSYYNLSQVVFPCYNYSAAESL